MTGPAILVARPPGRRRRRRSRLAGGWIPLTVPGAPAGAPAVVPCLCCPETGPGSGSPGPGFSGSRGPAGFVQVPCGPGGAAVNVPTVLYVTYSFNGFVNECGLPGQSVPIITPGLIGGTINWDGGPITGAGGQHFWCRLKYINCSIWYFYTWCNQNPPVGIVAPDSEAPTYGPFFMSGNVQLWVPGVSDSCCGPFSNTGYTITE